MPNEDPMSFDSRRNVTRISVSVEELRGRVSGPRPYFAVAVLGVMTFVAAPFLVVTTIHDQSPAWFSVLWIGGLGWNWYVGLTRFAYEIRLSIDGTLSFKSVLREQH